MSAVAVLDFGGVVEMGDGECVLHGAALAKTLIPALTSRALLAKREVNSTVLGETMAGLLF
jgi:hypothetical protein